LATEIQSVQRAISVLRAFAGVEEWSTSALARKLGLHKSVVHRLLVTLANGGLLTQDPRTGGFSLAPAMIALGRRAERGGGLRAIARPVLQRLAEESQETVSLCVIQDDHGLCIDVIESPQSMRFTVNPGESFPLHAGCIGKVILAFQPSSFVDALVRRGKLERLTENTITDPARLKRELARICREGYGFSDAEITPGARSVGAPVYDSDGQVTSSLVISAPSVRMTDASLDRFTDMVCRAAAQLSRGLGHRTDQQKTKREMHDAVQP
jgi:IclR family acetate operon transcriptional repressor